MNTQRGQSATEFLVIFPALVLLVFGIIQFGLLYQARATLNHATMLAARAGALHNGSASEMRAALARGLAPLFAAQASAEGYAAALLKAQVEASAALAALDVLNPSADALADFGRARLDGGAGSELPNDTLNYRSTTAGGKSKLSIQDANLLHLRVTYCVRLLVPIIDRILYATVNTLTPDTHVGLQATGMRNPFATGDEPTATPCGPPTAFGRRIPVQSEAFVRMQSPFFSNNVVASTGGTPGGGLPVPIEPPPTGSPGDDTGGGMIGCAAGDPTCTAIEPVDPGPPGDPPTCP
ncbi:TadE/TadG family type IV pilus assembly protein [Rhodoferax sp.]|uniref:TadE/TadG family type IV pilus assembly protein n=1 Tax=Rhodoferax sp. TaxID=50421 RepID=UPI002773033B|nr:pilus assembly protein [Rhodoferax sp.]